MGDHDQHLLDLRFEGEPATCRPGRPVIPRSSKSHEGLQPGSGSRVRPLSFRVTSPPVFLPKLSVATRSRGADSEAA
jgi:hypothetical protein